MSRPNRILALTLVSIIVLAVVAAVVSASRPVGKLNAGSPEAVVQEYLQAVFDGRTSDAARTLDPTGECTEADLSRNLPYGMQPSRVVLRSSTVNGSSARVEVKVVLTSGDIPPDSSEYSQSQTYSLRRSDQTWAITGTPWPLHECLKGG